MIRINAIIITELGLNNICVLPTNFCLLYFLRENVEKVL